MLLFASVVTMALAGWNAARLHHVDTINESHLFRGPAPVSNGTFVLDELTETMQAMAKKEAGVTIPDSFTLVVISMLDTIKGSEKKELQAEQAFFATQHPSLLAGSKLIHWPIVGAITSPSIYPKSLCLDKAKKYESSDSDKMVDKTKQIHDMMQAGANNTLLIYFHCDAGMDRTGEMYGDYQMRFNNQTYHQVSVRTFLCDQFEIVLFIHFVERSTTSTIPSKATIPAKSIQ
jgi:hypothetical protein